MDTVSPYRPLSLLTEPGRAVSASLKQARSFSRRYLLPKHRYVSDVLVLWYGSFGLRGGPTVGDLMAVNNVSAHLQAAGIDNRVVTADFDIADHVSVRSAFHLQPPRRGVVFVCGPLVDWTDLIDMLSICSTVPRVAVGVSVLRHHHRVLQMLDAVVARDGIEGATFDLSVAKLVPPASAWPAIRKVGVCLRGHQTEYRQSSDDQRAEAMLLALAAQYQLEVVPIDTLLSTRTPHDQFIKDLEQVDVVFTTRMHGALLSLAHGKPVIAIDQIRGGAKVTEVLSRVQWPHVFGTHEISHARLCTAFDQLQSQDGRLIVLAAQDRILAESKNAMAATLRTVTELFA